MSNGIRARVVLTALAAAVLAGCSSPTVAPPPVTTAAPATQQPSAAAPTPAPAPPAASPAPSGGVPRCTTAELRGSLGTGDAGAGSVFRPLLLTNTGTRTCELVGFPGVSYVAGDDGHQVGPAAEMDGPRTAQVNLAPGKAASAQLRLVNVRNFDEAACRPVAVRGVRVYPPGDTASLFVPFDGGEGCSTNPPGPQLFVQAVRPA
jgi:uncharacterized protein DUF4232